jgi:hypothetical protein
MRHAEAEHALRSPPWVRRSFDVLTADGRQNAFEVDTNAEQSLASRQCQLVLPSDTEVPFNRYSRTPFPSDLIKLPCNAPRNLLAFVSSDLGESFYVPRHRRNVSFFQWQADPYFPHGTMVGFGRYALFQVLGGSVGDRLAIELTDTLAHDGANLLPPAAVVGSSRSVLPLQGRGSARVFSPPLKPQVIGGTPYILLDMGVDGRLPVVNRPGLQHLYGRSVPIDPRYLTAYVRDISLVTAEQYGHLHPPSALHGFPANLASPNLEYSGLYEDGWIGADSYVRLAGGPSTYLVVQGEIPSGAGGLLQVFVDRHQVYSMKTAPGRLALRALVPAANATRRVELHFSRTIRLKAPDLRPAAAQLSFIGLESPQRSPKTSVAHRG